MLPCLALGDMRYWYVFLWVIYNFYVAFIDVLFSVLFYSLVMKLKSMIHYELINE